jgi:hypothetical protein
MIARLLVPKNVVLSVVSVFIFIIEIHILPIM